MTVSTARAANIFNGDGILTSWSLEMTLLISAQAEVSVLTAAGTLTDLTLNVDYSLSDVGYGLVASITYPLSGDPLPSGDKLIVTRTNSYLQDFYDVTRTSSFDTEQLEEAVDRTVLMVQDLNETVGRAIVMPNSVLAEDFDGSLDGVSAGQALRLDDDGLGISGIDLNIGVSEVDVFYQNRDTTAAAAAAALTQGTKVMLGGHPYTVETGASSANDLSVSGLQAGFINMNYYDVLAESLGVKFDGDEANELTNLTQMQAWVDWLRSEGQGGRIRLAAGGDLRMYGPLDWCDNLEIDGRGSRWENTVISGEISGSFHTNIFTMGGIATQDDSQYPFQEITVAITGGTDDTATVTDVSQFQVGDIVWLCNADQDFGAGSNNNDCITSSQFMEVIAINGSVLTFDQAIKEDYAIGSGTLGTDARGGWIAPASERTAIARPVDSAGRIFMCKRPRLYDVELFNQSGALMQRQGIYKGDFEGIESTAQYGFIYGNGMADVRFHNIKSRFNERAIEFKGRSQNTKGTDIWLYKDNSLPSNGDDNLITVGEASSDNSFEISHLNYGDHASIIFYFSDGKNNHYSVGNVHGGAAATSLIQFSADSSNNTVTRGAGGRFDVVGANRAFRLAGTDNIVSALDFSGATFSSDGGLIEATAVGGKVADCKFTGDDLITVNSGATGTSLVNNKGIAGATGAGTSDIHQKGNHGDSYQQILSVMGRSVTDVVTSSLTFDTLTSSVIEAGNLRQGDRLVWTLEGGSNLSAAAQMQIVASTSATTSTTTFPDLLATTTDWVLEFYLTTQNVSNTFVLSWKMFEDETPGGVDTRVGSGVVPQGSMAFDVNDLTISVNALVGNGADTITMRTSDKVILRDGFN